MITAVEKSNNAKTGCVSATYAPFQTCPESCPFRKNGCYGEGGPCGITANRITKASEGDTLESLAQQEADGIKKLSGKRPLRLHVTGDCSSDKAAQIVSDACADYAGPVWSYTHAWRDVSRLAWNPKVSIFASVETASDASKAHDRGYAVAMVAEPGTKADGFKVIQCPATKKDGIQCVNCKLCFNATKRFDKKQIIAFPPHGNGAKKVKAVINAK